MRIQSPPQCRCAKRQYLSIHLKAFAFGWLAVLSDRASILLSLRSFLLHSLVFISLIHRGSKFFSNGARPSGILTHPNTVKDPAALRASWNAAYGSSSNASRVAVLEEGVRPDRVLSKVEI